MSSIVLSFTFSRNRLQAILPLMFVHGHAGSSTNQLIHFGQSVNSGRFRKFDYGFIKNKIEYKQSTPPDYNLNNARAPVALYYSQNDWMSSVEDIHILKEHLPNLVKDYLIPHKRFKYVQQYINSLFLIINIFLFPLPKSY